MGQNLLVIGAGTGLSRAIAQRFGTDGWTVHLLARSAEGLQRLTDELTSAGIACRAYRGDVTNYAALSEIVAGIDAEYPLDAMVFQPRGADAIVDVLDATVDNVRSHLNMLVLGAIAAAAPLVPKMLERGAGAMVFVGGGSARTPLRMFGNLGPAMAGLRNYAMTLNAGIAKRGLYSAFFTVAGPIGTEGSIADGELDPAVLADRMFNLVRDRDAKEVLMTPEGEIALKGSR